MPKPRKRRDKAYRPRAVKDTTYLLTEREPPSTSDATTIKIVYSQIYERVRTGAADERDLWSMAALPDNDIRADWLRRWRTQGLNAQQTHDTYQTQRKQTIDKH